MGAWKYKVVVSLYAQQDIEEIARQINLKSPQNAILVVNRIFDMIESLETYPTRFSIYRGLEGIVGIYRSVVVSNHIIVYSVQDKERRVIIHDVHFGGENR